MLCDVMVEYIWLIGVLGIMINRRNIVVILMSIELMLVGVNMSLVLNAVYLDDLIGEVFGIMVLTVAAAESAIGLGILIVYYRVRGSIGLERIIQG